jgi:hypothetical protein
MPEQKNKTGFADRFTKTARTAALLTAAALPSASCGGDPAPHTGNTFTSSQKTHDEKLAELKKLVDDLEVGLNSFTDIAKKYMPKPELGAENWKAVLPDFKVIKDALAKEDYVLAVQSFKLQPMIDFRNRWESAVKMAEQEPSYEQLTDEQKKLYLEKPHLEELHKNSIRAERELQLAMRDMNAQTFKLLETRVFQAMTTKEAIGQVGYEKNQSRGK